MIIALWVDASGTTCEQPLDDGMSLADHAANVARFPGLADVGTLINYYAGYSDGCLGEWQGMKRVPELPYCKVHDMYRPCQWC